MEEPTNYRKTAMIGALGAAMFAAAPKTVEVRHDEAVPLQEEYYYYGNLIEEELFCFGQAYQYTIQDLEQAENLWICNAGENGPIARTFEENIYVNMHQKDQFTLSTYRHEQAHLEKCGWPQANYLSESATESYAADNHAEFSYTPQYAQLNFWGQWVETHIGVSPVTQEFDCENRITTFEFYEIMMQRIDELEIEEDIKIWLKKYLDPRNSEADMMSLYALTMTLHQKDPGLRAEIDEFLKDYPSETREMFYQNLKAYPHLAELKAPDNENQQWIYYLLALICAAYSGWCYHDKEDKLKIVLTKLGLFTKEN